VSFNGDVLRFVNKVDRVTHDTFVGTVAGLFESIVEGSALTGSPGQPVDTSDLKTSWQIEFESKDAARVLTNSDHAEPIEYGIGEYGALELRSAVGGFHSVAATVANADRVLQAELKKAQAANE
jgi:hypothetical protein